MKKKIVIFGTGYYGRNVFRICKNKKIKAIFFIDNNYKNIKKKLMGINVHKPDVLKKKYDNYDYVILAGRYIKEMKKQISDLKVDNKKILKWGKKDLLLSKKNFLARNQDFIDTMKLLVKNFNKNNLNYWIDAGSLLCLARKQEFAEFSDVEVMVHYKDFDKLKFFFKTLDTKKYILKKRLVFYSKLLKRKLYQFTMYKRPKNKDYEPAIVEFNILVNKKNLYENIALKKDVTIFNWTDKKLIKYHDLYLPIMYNYKNYLKYIYGKSWKIKKNFYSK